jgi:Cd2+/Zn2+-exporting ATPase
VTEHTLELDIPRLLPGVDDDADACLARLEAALQDHTDLRRAHLERDKRPVALCLHYDPAVVSPADVQRLAERAGAGILSRYHHALIPVEGMDCSDCAKVIEHGVGRLDGVLSVNVSYPQEEMRVEFDAQKTRRNAIEHRLRGLGYGIPATGLRQRLAANREILFSLLAGLALVIGWTGAAFFAWPPLAAWAFYAAAYTFGGWDVSRHALHALRQKHFDTDLLMILAALGAAALGAWSEGALLLFLFSLGHALEERALDHARAAVRALAALTPKTALVVRGGPASEVPVDQLQLSDTVIVRPGARVPVDGIVLSGQSSLDQAPVTGESMPVDKAPGDFVYAGSVNGAGALDVQVTRLAKDSTLARVMKLVEEAQNHKSPTQQTVERFSRVFVPAVLLATALLIFVPPLLGVPFSVSFLRAMTLLVAASPCALALGTPAAVLAGVAQAARNGVLVKGGVHLENLGRLEVVAFDKTGTLTHGRPELTDVVTLSPAHSPDDVLALAAAVEGRSAHPLAQAVVRAAQARGLVLPPAAEVESLTGRGLRSTVTGRAVLIGNLALMEDSGINVPAAAREQLESLQASGKTTMIVALAGQRLGLLALADTLRSETTPALAALRRAGVRHTVMLTGDNALVAAAVARQAGLTDYRAGLLPEDKVAAIRALVAEHGSVAMVGDGVNDAPALAHATVGIAMGGAGTDAALETADVALMGDDLARLPFALGLGRATRAVIQQNLAIALGVIAVLIIASITGWAGIGLAILLHEGSTLVVVANALRLLGYRPV